MAGADVVEIVARLQDAEIRVWLDGGWGVDALLGEETRPHSDLDLVIGLDEAPKAVQALEPLGYRIELDARPTRFVLAHTEGRHIDFHPIVFDQDGNGWQRGAGPTGGDALYPADGLTGVGRVAGRDVACLTPELLVRHHTGYEPQEKDWHNVRLLCERFGLPVPRGYQRWADSRPGA